MKISKNTKKSVEAEAAFDAIVSSLFEFQNLKIEDFEKEKVMLVSFNGEKGSDYNFDYATFSSGIVGQLVTIKSISSKIFGKPVDPRKIIDKVNEKIQIKNQIQK